MARPIDAEFRDVDTAMDTWARERRGLPMVAGYRCTLAVGSGVIATAPEYSDVSEAIDAAMPTLYGTNRVFLQRYYAWNDPKEAIMRRLEIGSARAFDDRRRLALTEIRGALRSKGFKV
jgi:hypothetical protein